MKILIRATVVVVIVAFVFVARSSTMLEGDPASESRAALLHGLLKMAARAQRHYYSSPSQGGGNGSFTSSQGGISIVTIMQLTSRPTTSNGTYVLGTVSATAVVMTGIGYANGTDGNLVEVVVWVFSDSVSVMYSN